MVYYCIFRKSHVIIDIYLFDDVRLYIVFICYKSKCKIVVIIYIRVRLLIVTIETATMYIFVRQSKFYYKRALYNNS